MDELFGNASEHPALHSAESVSGRQDQIVPIRECQNPVGGVAALELEFRFEPLLAEGLGDPRHPALKILETDALLPRRANMQEDQLRLEQHGQADAPPDDRFGTL